MTFRPRKRHVPSILDEHWQVLHERRKVPQKVLTAFSNYLDVEQNCDKAYIMLLLLLCPRLKLLDFNGNLQPLTQMQCLSEVVEIAYNTHGLPKILDSGLSNIRDMPVE